jgi:hypothetical protein
MITDHAEGTFASLRYFFGGDHPSQTTHHTMSFSFQKLVPKYKKAGISTTTPQPLAWPLQCLPAILHILYSDTM